MFYCGTSGFSYDDWIGIYYPAVLPRRNWLSYYAQEFNALELNSTYYALPGVSAMESLARKTGGGFLFSVKANREMTHERENARAACQAFVRILQPLIEAGKLGCVLAQFPYSFKFSEANRGYLLKLREWMGGLPLVIEFRNTAWLDPGTFEWMRQNSLAFCCVDEPQIPGLLPPIVAVTAPTGYLRFHGRNAARWWNHEHAWERYDYTYTGEELAGWLPGLGRIAREAEDTFIFANNHWRGQAVDTIRQVRSMLDQLVM